MNQTIRIRTLIVLLVSLSAGASFGETKDAPLSPRFRLGRPGDFDRKALDAAIRSGQPIQVQKRPGSPAGPIRLEITEERPRDSYIPPRLAGPRFTSPPVRVSRGRLISVQVNTDALGQNILGDAANEPSLTVDPTNLNRMAIGWRQFDSVASDFRQAGVAYTADGGQTWTSPGVLEPGVFRSDPVLDADSLGNFYYSSLTRDQSFVFSVHFFKSVTGGASWGSPIYSFGGDKQWIAIDRTSGPGDGHIYQFWSIDASCCGGVNFTRSTDAGATFPISSTMTPPFLRWGTMTVTPDGTLHAAGAALNTSLGHVVARSLNAQLSVQAPVFTDVQGVYLGGVTIGGFVNPAGLLGQVWIDSDHSAGPRNGNLYVLASVMDWFNFSHDVRFIRSVDGGTTWSDPDRVNDDPMGSAWHWFGAISVAPNGRIDATWFDTRNDATDPTEPLTSEVFYSCSYDGGRTWSPNVPVSPPFNHYLGYPQQDKLGDYTQMRSDLGGVNLAYAATFNGEQDVYFLRIPADCNNNGVEDPDDIAAKTSDDCNFNFIPDECEPDADCNGNKIRDICDIGSGLADDCDGNLVPDACQDDADCNENLRADVCDFADGTSQDCNGNGVPDECDINAGTVPDRNDDGIIDGWQGVCCLCDEGCVTTSGADCSVRDGVFSDPGFTCVDRGCPPPPENDDCANAIKLPGDVASFVPFTNRCTSTDGATFVKCDNGFQPFGSDVWFNYRPLCDGLVTVSLCAGTDYDSILAAYDGGSGCTCPSVVATPVTCGDDTCGFGGGPSYIEFDGLRDQCYVIRAAGWAGSQGSGFIETTLEPTLGGLAPGDCDHNGVITLGDLRPFVGCLAGLDLPEDVCCGCADSSGNGVVGLEDYAALQRNIETE